ncbi:hypothetical protein QAD02_010743 [Eretmocerus hayati]|uniref:Uncharacterized protein n=1 Tax=Eretmocerus hayati TaxID=131215 RepID=A0ACC2NV62_9HYME|nr:hypothetical protein QAD02_010743 [Eretmocerus hayati]
MRVALPATPLLLLLVIGLIFGLLFFGIKYKSSGIFDWHDDDDDGVDKEDFGPELRECLRHNKPADIVRCAKSVDNIEEKISHNAFAAFLRQLMNKIESQESSTDARLASLGLTSSSNTCRQSHFIDVTPLKTKKPVLLYLVGIIPNLRDWSNRPSRPQRYARGKLFPAFSSNSSRFRVNVEKNCTGYHYWVRDNLHLYSDSAADLRVAIVMDGKLWCPRSFITAAKVVIADIYEDDVKLTEYNCERVYKISWALWREGSYGIVPKKFEHIFLT